MGQERDRAESQGAAAAEEPLEEPQPQRVNTELAKAFQDLAKGERTASALESRLDEIESRIDQLLASVDSPRGAPGDKAEMTSRSTSSGS